MFQVSYEDLLHRRQQVRTVTDEAVNRVEQHADAEWMERVFRVVCDIARARETFTANEIWDVIENVGDFPVQHEPSALGAVMRRVARERIAQVVAGVSVKSLHARQHGRGLRVWRSLIYIGREG